VDLVVIAKPGAAALSAQDVAVELNAALNAWLTESPQS
jgi:hypothetical protein